jgi:hypothetical protein
MHRHIETDDWEAELAEWLYVEVREERMGRWASAGLTGLLVAGVILVAAVLR